MDSAAAASRCRCSRPLYLVDDAEDTRCQRCGRRPPVLIPVPRTLPDRYAPRFRERARQLHVDFWESRDDPPHRLA
jgi:hypothetical protein